MKVLIFGGGLGNQIFEYAFYLYAKKHYDGAILGYYPKSLLSEHYGLEINKWFDVNLPEQKWYVPTFTLFIRAIHKIFPRFKLLDNHLEIDIPKSLVQFALKSNKRYMPTSQDWLVWKITPSQISDKNKACLERIRCTNSFFIHVRRGDYLSPQYYDRFKGTCTIEYYQKALQLLTEKNPDACFFIFSNDLQWTRNNLQLKGFPVEYIDWNTGTNSPLDMFLMSQCKGGIIANSTFSFWAAQLGVEKRDVYYPNHWFSSGYKESDLYYKETWTKIEY